MSYQRCFYNYTYTEKYKLVLTVSPRFCPRVKQMNQLASYTKLNGVLRNINCRLDRIYPRYL